MADFNSEFWSWFISIIVIAGIVWLLVMLRMNSTGKLPAGGKAEVTGHVWDGDLQELNTPLPRWWLILFYVTIAFSIVYLIIYPGLGSFKGLAGWSEVGQYNAEVADANAKYGPLLISFI